MTQDEIIRMARDTGKTKWFGTHEDGTNDFLGVEFTPEQLERFAALVAEAEREKIALAYKTRPRGKSEAPHMIAAYRAMQMALKALGNLKWAATERDAKNRIRQFDQFVDEASEAITALREALAQPQDTDTMWWDSVEPKPKAQPQDHSEQHLNMVQGEWVDLTDKELEAIWRETISDMACMKATIAKFKSKNTPPVVPQGQPDCYAVLTPLGSRLVSPEEAKGRVMAYPLYTTPPSVEAAIEATKEKAAKVCEEFTANMRHQSTEAHNFALECSKAIREMK